MSLPTLTLVISNLNDGPFIDAAFEPIEAQADQLERIILIDDGSDDDSVAQMKAFACRVRQTKVICNTKRLGVIANYNSALDTVTTDLVVFASSNDIILPGLFARSRQILGDHPRAGLSSALVRYMSLEAEPQEVMASPIPLRRDGYLAPETARRILFREGEWTIGNTTIYRVSALRAVGGFRPELFGACDGFASTWIACRFGACFMPRVLAMWRHDPAGYANSTIDMFDRASSVLTTIPELIAANAQIFPPGYAARWRSRWLFAVLVSAANKGPARLAAALKAFNVSGFPTFLGFSPRLARIALLFRLRRFDLWPILVRRMSAGVKQLRTRFNNNIIAQIRSPLNGIYPDANRSAKSKDIREK